MLKCDEKFLYVLLTLSQEQNIKTGRFAMIYADEVIVSHTNENEYTSFVGNKKSRGAAGPHHPGARCPTTCASPTRCGSTRSCCKQSALQTCTSRRTRCASPASSRCCRGWSRPKKAGMSLMKKLKLYDGEDVEGFKPARTSRSCRTRREREGMDGISPRYVINRAVAARSSARASTCINPIDALRALRDGLEQHTAITASSASTT